ncbi:MAG: lysylphosphatidylglycerol synthase transmembrane domain-containing protein [Terriglobia bacterium]
MNFSTSPQATPTRARWWLGLRIFFLLLGLTLLVVLVQRVGMRRVLAQAVGVGWYFAAIVVLFGGVHILRTLSWRLCLNEPGRHIPFWSLWGFWLAGESVSHLSFAWSGEAFRAVATRELVSVEQGLSAQLVSRALYTYASLCWVALGFLLVWWAVRLEGVVYSMMLGGTLASLAILLLATAALLAQGRMVAPLTRWLERRQQRRPHPLRARLVNFLRALESDLAALVGSNRRRFIRLLGWNLLAALAGVAEVYLVLRGLGTAPAPAQAFVIESLEKLLSLGAYLIPGNLGVREGGTILILKLLGLAAVFGINLALIRRARALVWVAVGTLWLVRQGVSPRAWVQPAAEEIPADQLGRKAPSARSPETP